MNQVGGESDFLSFGAGEYGRSVSEVEKMVELAGIRPNHLFLMAWEEDRLVGALTLEGSSRGRLEHATELGMTVAKPLWGRHLGRALLSHAVEWCRESPTLSKINLQVRADHERAIRLYSSSGFIREGLLPRGMLVRGVLHDLTLMGLKL